MSLEPKVVPLEDATGIENIDGLYGYALVLTRNRSDAEDLVQETYVRAIGAMGRLRPESNVKGWLFTILRNIWLNHLRKRRGEPGIVDMDIEDNSGLSVASSDDPHTHFVSRMEHRQVSDAIGQLSADLREVIVLREYEDMSYRDIATILDCPVGTVMSRLARARAKLRNLLSAAFQTSLQSGKAVTE
jgi:RNA polymerase sigma-70 factor (ECF subfamily)